MLQIFLSSLDVSRLRNLGICASKEWQNGPSDDDKWDRADAGAGVNMTTEDRPRTGEMGAKIKSDLDQV